MKVAAGLATYRVVQARHAVMSSDPLRPAWETKVVANIVELVTRGYGSGLLGGTAGCWCLSASWVALAMF